MMVRKNASRLYARAEKSECVKTGSGCCDGKKENTREQQKAKQKQIKKNKEQ